MKPPEGLIAAFRAAELPEHLAALMVEDGWDAEAMRVLGAWQHAENRWTAPADPCPDGGVLPTAAAWAWICRGWTVDLPTIAEGAGVSIARADELVVILMRNALIFPDGQMANSARAALRSHVADRLIKAKKSKPMKKKDDDDAN